VGKQLYEVRIRCKVSEGREQKKSKFYWLNKPCDANRVYKGSGSIISVEKVSREKLLGVGDYFPFGESLLGEFNVTTAQGGDVINEILGRGGEKLKSIKRRTYAAKQRETSY